MHISLYVYVNLLEYLKRVYVYLVFDKQIHLTRTTEVRRQFKKCLLMCILVDHCRISSDLYVYFL